MTIKQQIAATVWLLIVIAAVMLFAPGCAYRGQSLVISADSVTVIIGQRQDGGGSLRAEGVPMP